MKRIFTVLAIMVGLVLPMQAQIAPISKEINTASVNRPLKKKVKAEATDITINDLVGTFDAYAYSAFQGYPDEEWKLTITRDETDAEKLWLHPIMQIPGLALSEITPIYATYSQEAGTLTIPLGQTIYGDGVVDVVFATCDADYAPIHTGEITLPVTGNPSDIMIEVDMLVGCGDVLSADGWWYQALAYTTFTKTIPAPAVYVTLNDEDKSVIRVDTEELYFVDYENETYLSTAPEYVSDAVAGTYKAYAMSGFQGEPDENWTVTITRDEVDANKVWIDPIFVFGGLTANEMNAVYGTFNEAAGTIAIPLGQVLYEEPGYTMILGEADVNNGFAPITTGEIVVTVVKNNGVKVIEIPNFIGAGNLDEGDEGWWYQALAYTTYTSVETIIAPLSEISTVSRKMAVPEIDGFFDEGSYTWSFLISEDEVNWEQYSSKTQFEYSGVVDLGDFYGQGAAGVVAYEWNVSGFMDDLGYFELNNGTAATFNAYSYNMNYEGNDFECLDLLDPSGNPLTIGSITLQNQDGSTFLTDVYLGELSGNNIYYNLGFVVDGDVAMYNGESAILWFILNDQAYLLANYDELTISRNNAPYAVRKAAKINFYEQPIAVKNVGGFKKTTFNK
ncbi:MAG: hypothetical protein IKM35_04440 [Bacteroidaceae bacterium]|nr:hypothetical protein [Bacteroidaceae bacterium]